MTDEDIAVKITALEHETKSAKHRLDELEVQSQAIQDLAMSVKEMSINMSSMLEEQKRQGERLNMLEKEPADNWKNMKRTILTSMVSAIGGALVVGLIVLLAQYVQ